MGAIALEYGANYPHKVQNIILAAGAVDPDNEKYFWFGKIGKRGLTRTLLPKKYKTTAKEKYTHVDELIKLKSKLKDVTARTIIAHGDKDEIVPFINVEYLKKTLRTL